MELFFCLFLSNFSLAARPSLNVFKVALKPNQSINKEGTNTQLNIATTMIYFFVYFLQLAQQYFSTIVPAVHAFVLYWATTPAHDKLLIFTFGWSMHFDFEDGDGGGGAFAGGFCFGFRDIFSKSLDLADDFCCPLFWLNSFCYNPLSLLCKVDEFQPERNFGLFEGWSGGLKRDKYFV